MLPCFSFFLPWYYLIYPHFITVIGKFYSKTQWCKKTLSIFTRNDLNIPLYEIYKNDDDDDYSWLHWLLSYGESHGYSTDSSETFTRQKTLKPQTRRATPGQKSRSALWLNARANTQTSLTHSCWETLLLIWSGVSAS